MLGLHNRANLGLWWPWFKPGDWLYWPLGCIPGSGAFSASLGGYTPGWCHRGFRFLLPPRPRFLEKFENVLEETQA